jgi:hypothetical protein
VPWIYCFIQERIHAVRYILFTLFFLTCPAVAADNLHGGLTIVVTDKRTHFPLPGARVCLGLNVTCRTTDSIGRATFDSLAPGRYDAEISAPGFEGITEPNILVHQGTNNPVSIEIAKETIFDLDKVTVVSHRLSQTKPEQSTSVTHLSNFELSNTPGTANDINRVLSFHPGVVSSAGSITDNSLFVRGGQSLENVYVIDGLELDNANHFSDVGQSGGAIGFIDGALVEGLDFYTGGFPADLPPRLSSIIDMKLRSGSMTTRSTECDLSMTGLGLTLDGPIIAGSSSYLASCRILDVSLLQPLLRLTGVPRFGDGMIKLYFKLNDQHSISVLGIGAIDNYKENGDSYGFPTQFDRMIYQGGGIAAWKWATGAFKNDFSFSGSLRNEKHYDQAINAADATTPDTFKANLSEWNRNSRIIDSLIQPTDTLYIEQGAYSKARLRGFEDRRSHFEVKEQATFYVRENDQIGLGGDLSNTRYRIGSDDSWTANTFYLFRTDSGSMNLQLLQNWNAYAVDSSLDVRHAGAYLEYVYHQDRVKAIAGVRGDYFSLLTDYGISPRLGLRFDLNPLGVFSLSAGLYYQFPSDFTGLIGSILADNPNQVYENPPQLNQVRLERNWQGVLGYERQFGKNHVLSLETYYKWYDHEYPFATPDERHYGDYSGGQLVWLFQNPQGKKKSYGVEVQFQKKNFDELYYSFSYSLFTVKNQYVNGQWYNDENNLRNTLGMIVGSNFFKNHGVSLRVNASEGRPYSAIKSLGPTMGYEYDTAKGYFSERLPPVISAGFRYSFTIERAWGSTTGYIEIWNALNQRTVIERDFDPQNGYNDIRGPGIVPTLGVTVKF